MGKQRIVGGNSSCMHILRTEGEGKGEEEETMWAFAESSDLALIDPRS